jgi:hypothetical protein
MSDAEVRMTASAQARLLRSLFLLSMLVSSSAGAAGWTRDQGHFYLQLGTAFSYADQRYSNTGELGPILVPKLKIDPSTTSLSNYQQLLTDLYFEVGVLPRLTVIGDLPFVSARQLNPGGDITYSANNFGDMTLGMRVGLLLRPIAVAAEARLGFPTGAAKQFLPTGSGDFRGELRLAVSRNFYQLLIPIYFDVEFGFMMRGAGRVYDPVSASPDHTSLINFAPEIYVRGEVGAIFFAKRTLGRTVLALAADYRGSTTKADTTAALVALYPENGEYTTINLSVMVYLWRGLGVTARFARNVEGLRLPQLTTFGGAIFAEF